MYVRIQIDFCIQLNDTNYISHADINHQLNPLMMMAWFGKLYIRLNIKEDCVFPIKSLRVN